MTDRRLTDAQIATALRAHLPASAMPGLAQRVRAEVAATPQRRALPRIVAGLGEADPMGRRRSLLVAAAILLAVVLAGVAAVGAWRLLQPDLLSLPPLLPANGLIAISANPTGVGGGEAGDIYLVGGAAGTRRIIGSDGDGVAQACPKFSPDGRRLAYGEARASDLPVSSFRGDWPVPDRAVVMVGLSDDGVASAPILRVTPPAGVGEIPCPEWSPDGTHIAFRIGSELWIVDAESGRTTVLEVFGAPMGQLGFEWSRDGSMIAVAEDGQIHVVPVDGRPSFVIPVPGDTPGSLGWTAGDTGIVYISTDAPGDGLAIHVLDVASKVSAKVSQDGIDVRLRFDHLVVSSDGTRVAYQEFAYRCTSNGCATEGPRILIMDPDGSNQAVVVVPPDFWGFWLQWSPDGERLMGGSIDSVVSVSVVPGSPAIVHSSGELNLEWSADELTWQTRFQ